MPEETEPLPADVDVPVLGYPRRDVVATVVVIALVALVGGAALVRHRSGSSEPAASDRASALQLRGVRSIVTLSSPLYAQTKVTCGPDDPCTAEDLLHASNIVLADGTGVKYRLGPVAVTGDDVASARAAALIPGTQAWAVDFRLTNTARVRFAELTARLAEVLPPRQIAMIVNGEVIQALTVQSPVTTGTGQIGNLTEDEAKALAARLG